MLVPFLIMLREGVEAALIVGIVASYLKQIGRADAMPMVFVGILLALALSLFVGAGLQFASAEFPQKAQELFEAFVGVLAVSVLTSMVFWMRKASRSIKRELQASVDAAVSGGHPTALIGMVFFAVAREGLESVFFLLAVFQQSNDPFAPLGALLGVIVAILVGFAVYAGGVRLDLRKFFRWTGVFILFVAAGILSSAVRSLHEAGVWNHLQTTAFDFGHILPGDSVFGMLFAGLFGYQENPNIGQVMAYLLFLGVTLTLFFLPPGASGSSELAGRPNLQHKA